MKQKNEQNTNGTGKKDYQTNQSPDISQIEGLYPSRSNQIKYKSPSFNCNSSNSGLSFNTFLNYSFLEDSIKKEPETIDSTGTTLKKDSDLKADNYTNIALRSKNLITIQIPKKAEYAIRHHIPSRYLNEIHSDRNVAIDMCLLFSSKLASTYFEIKNDPKCVGWKSLSAELLQDYFTTSSNTYLNIIKALEYELQTGSVIECDKKKQTGVKNYYYRLGKSYIGKGIVGYELKTDVAKKLHTNRQEKLFAEALENLICRNLINVYPTLTFPSLEEIRNKGKWLVKIGYKTKKGKLLTILNKQSKSCFKEAQNRSYVEDDIELYQHLTKDGLMVPRPGNEHSGGRIVDSITLMPSWIRNMIKINGRGLLEADYKCLHPNIAIKLYGGQTEYVTHEKLAEKLGLDKGQIKREHLSFFNDKIVSMRNYKVFKYYEKNEPEMLLNLIEEKKTDNRKYKITSERMFKKEVEIMTDVISILNYEGIYVLYVYDALLCAPDHAERLKQVMNETILKHGVKTVVELSIKIEETEIEKWVAVPEYKGLYEINEKAQVRSLNYKNYQKLMEQRGERAGYKTVRLSNKGKINTVFVHRLMGLTYINNADKKCCVNHLDGNKTNNSLNNLEWVTHSENMKHAYKLGLIKSLPQRCVPIIDTCSGGKFESIKKAADFYSIPYSTCKSYLNGNRTNPTCLQYEDTWLEERYINQANLFSTSFSRSTWRLASLTA